jgi:hypothetical protein
VWDTPDWELDILLAGIAGECGLDRGDGLRLYPRGQRGRQRRGRPATDVPMGGDMEHPSWDSLPMN